MALKAERLILSALLALLAAHPAYAQLDDEVPHASYYLAKEAFYLGEYREAERELRRETRRGIRTTQARWIDAICYHAMLGEVLYHQGRNPEALAEFDQACQLLLAYPNWLLQVRFQQPPRPDPSRARRAPPWATSQRQFTLGQLPPSEQVLTGELNASRVLQEGGVYRTPMLWRINVVEVVRAAALAIRRRSEILGPLAPHDPISRELADELARGNLAPPNHWSNVWVDLLRGLAVAGLGKFDEADALIGRAVVVDGQFDYPLTCVVLFEQGRIAMLRGDSRRAAQLLSEANLSAYFYENWDVLTESAWLGWLNHLASGGAGIYPLLEPIAAWGQVNRLQHVAVKLRLANAESLTWLGQIDAAAAVLEDVGRRIGDMRAGLSGVHLLYVQSAVQITRGQLGPGSRTLDQALAAQAGASKRNFQLARTTQMFDSRTASPRVANELYGTLLSDPAPAEWVFDPLDCMAVLRTPHEAAFDRWFLAALERKEPTLALEVAESAKRRRFLAARPLGGRLLALRSLLEMRDTELSREALLQRQQMLVSFPAYKTLADAGQKLIEQLRAGPVLATNPADAKSLSTTFAALARNTGQRQQLLAQFALRRLPSKFEFPPLRTVAELQGSLAEGEALVMFHAAAGNMYGLLVTRPGIHVWQLPEARRVRTAVGDFLRSLGNYGPSRAFTTAELASPDWRKKAADAYKVVFADARLDLGKTTELVIVPDGVLWYLPFAALLPAAGPAEATLGQRMPIRFGPTAALALPNERPLRRVQRTGIVANEMLAGTGGAEGSRLLDELEKVITGPLRIPTPLPEPQNLILPLLDALIVLDGVSADRAVGYSVSPLPRPRGASSEDLGAWFGLPHGGPERIVLAGFATEAEQGLRAPRRSSRPATAAARPGDELFHMLCSLMADGARTMLVTRWRTGGRTHFELVREFMQELPHGPATEAWQRAVLLARETMLDPSSEPRLKRTDEVGQLPTADHPLFWAGYLLVDISPRPEQKDAQVEDAKAELSSGEGAEESESAVESAPQPTAIPPAE